MTERTSYAAGTPCWVDLACDDVDVAATFYGELFGWTAPEAGPAEETGGYRMFLKDGKQVAGLGPKQSPEQPTAWSTYVSVDDAAAAAAGVRDAGGQVLAEPFAVMQFGHMAVFMDAGGAAFSVWQPGEHFGAEVVNEVGALIWNELVCRDAEGAKDFYGKVFGWTAETAPMGETSYTQFMLGGASVAGMLEMGDNFPPQAPPNWLPYFAVADCDITLARAGELGGSTLMEPFDLPMGRFAVAADPQGAPFAFIAMSA